jgi:3-deoxy-7-phosphoheptulonate synthase
MSTVTVEPETPPAAISGLPEPKSSLPPLSLVAGSSKRRRTVVRVGNVEIGAGRPVVIAGPCSVESFEQTRATAEAVKSAGAVILRGGAYKPRTSPYDFQGLGVEGLKILQQIRKETGLPVVSEVLSTDDIEIVADHVDMLQVGARNMQNFALLRRLGQLRKPILLKRSPAATVQEWLLAAEYLLAGGNDQVVLCERGIRSFDPDLRNTLDLAGMALARQLTHLPVIADPSHATGRRDLIPAMSRAALAAGVDGLIVEVHPDPAHALSDGFQSMDFPGFICLMEALRWQA